MEYFLLSNMPFLGHQPEENKIKRFQHKNNTFWSTALQNVDMFAVNTYSFDAFIIYINPDEVGLIKNIKGPKHVVIKSKVNRSILRELGADVDLCVKVYFV